MARKTKDNNTFVKQVPHHPRERLKQKRKSTLDNNGGLSKKRKDDNVTFIKQVPLHPRGRKKRIERLDQKVDIIKEIATAKPKPIKAKRKIDKIKF